MSELAMRHNPMHILGLVSGLLLLAGCESGGWSLTQGGMSDAVTSFASDHSLSFACARYDPATGNMTEQVTVQRNLSPDAAAVGALAAGFQAVLGLAGAMAKPAAPVPPAVMAPHGIPPGYTLDVPACLGQAGVNTAMPLPPNPAPPQTGQAPRGDDDHPSLMPLPRAHPASPQHPSSEPLG